MTKAELVSEIAKQERIPHDVVKDVLDGFIKIAGDRLAKGEQVVLHGFGIFKAVNREAHTGRNPKTGESIQIEAKTVIKFKPSSTLVDLVN